MVAAARAPWRRPCLVAVAGAVAAPGLLRQACQGEAAVEVAGQDPLTLAWVAAAAVAAALQFSWQQSSLEAALGEVAAAEGLTAQLLAPSLRQSSPEAASAAAEAAAARLRQLPLPAWQQSNRAAATAAGVAAAAVRRRCHPAVVLLRGAGSRAAGSAASPSVAAQVEPPGPFSFSLHVPPSAPQGPEGCTPPQHRPALELRIWVMLQHDSGRVASFLADFVSSEQLSARRANRGSIGECQCTLERQWQQQPGSNHCRKAQLPKWASQPATDI